MDSSGQTTTYSFSIGTLFLSLSSGGDVDLSEFTFQDLALLVGMIGTLISSTISIKTYRAKRKKYGKGKQDE